MSEAVSRKVPRQSIGALLAALAALMALLALGVPAAPWLGDYLRVERVEAVGPSEATLLTYSVDSFALPGSRQSALAAAAARYRQGETAVILLGVLDAGPAGGGYETRAALAVRSLTRSGVPAGAIEVLPAVSDTRGEALALRRAAEGRGWHRVVAYAPDFRARRTRGALRQTTRSLGLDVQVVGVDAPRVGLDRWWQGWRGRKAVVGEYAKLAYYAARGWLAD